MKKYNEIDINVIKISSEDIITGSPDGGGAGGGFTGEGDNFAGPSTDAPFYENE